MKQNSHPVQRYVLVTRSILDMPFKHHSRTFFLAKWSPQQASVWPDRCYLLVELKLFYPASRNLRIYPWHLKLLNTLADKLRMTNTWKMNRIPGQRTNMIGTTYLSEINLIVLICHQFFCLFLLATFHAHF